MNALLHRAPHDPSGIGGVALAFSRVGSRVGSIGIFSRGISTYSRSSVSSSSRDVNPYSDQADCCYLLAHAWQTITAAL